MRYLIALIFAFSVTAAGAQTTPQDDNQNQRGDTYEQRGQQEDYGMENEDREMRDQRGQQEEGELRGEHRAYGAEFEDPSTIYMSEDDKLKVKEAEEGEVVIQYKKEGFNKQEAEGRTEGYGLEEGETRGGEEEARTEEEEQQFDTVFESEDENITVMENEQGDLKIKYNQENAGQEQNNQENAGQEQNNPENNNR